MAKPDISRPQDGSASAESAFPALFNGAESPEAVKLRKELFDTAWPVLEGRIQVSMPCFGEMKSVLTRLQHVLRDANRTTLDEVTAFLQQAAGEDTYVSVFVFTR